MTDIAIMIEGQNGLTWERWMRIARFVEDAGFAGLYRSDHFTNSRPPDIDSLELWVSLAWLAANTERIEFGPLVTPMSFRSPVFTARMGKDVDELSGGRFILGIGAGWQEREHDLFGFDLLPVGERFDRFEEGAEVVSRLLRDEGPVHYEGAYFQLSGAQLLPRPSRPSGPPLLIGGNGRRRTLPLVARLGDEWNGLFTGKESLASLNALLDSLLEAAGRLPGEVRRSLMTGLVFGADQAQLDRKLAARGQTAEELRQRGLVVGVGTAVADQVAELGEVGMQRVMLQWLDLDDMDGLEALAKAVD